MFHPEAVRYANYVSRASGLRGTGMSLFAVGGTSGWALGPLLLTGAVLAVGLRGTALVAVLPLRRRRCCSSTTATWSGSGRTRSTEAHEIGDGVNHWGVFTLAAGSAAPAPASSSACRRSCRSTSGRRWRHSEGVGNASASVLMVFGARWARCRRPAGRPHRLPPGGGRSLARDGAAGAGDHGGAAGGRVRADGADRVRDGDELLPAGRDRPDALPRHVGFASGVILGLSIGAGAGMTALARRGRRRARASRRRSRPSRRSG